MGAGWPGAPAIGGRGRRIWRCPSKWRRRSAR